MIGHPALGKVVGADALGAVAAAHQCAARCGLFRFLPRPRGVKQFRLQQAHGAGAVFVLGALVLTFHHDAGGHMRQPHRRIGFVHMLATGAGSAKGVHADVGLVQLHARDGVLLRQHRHRTRRRVNAPLGFRFRHALDAMGAGLELQALVHALAGDAGDDLFEAAVFAGALA